MALNCIESYTIEDYKHWEGDWELIGGFAYAMSSFALPTHQKVNLNIARQLDEVLEECDKCEALIETEIYLREDTVIRPDSFVICYPLSDKLTKAPSIVFEVVSKNSSKRDEILKFSLYEEEVKYYCLVYPDLKKAKIYELQNYKYHKVGDFSDESFVFDVDCKIEFNFSKIWLKEKK